MNMKKTALGAILITAMLAAVLLLAACNQVTGPDNHAGFGTVRVDINGEAPASAALAAVRTDLLVRTIYPDLPDVDGLYYTYTVKTSPGGETVTNVTQAGAELTLPNGSYTIDVEAYLEAEHTTKVGTGSSAAFLVDNNAQSVPVILNPVETGTGGISITLKYPAPGVVTFNTLDWSGGEINYVESDPENGFSTATYINNAYPAGSYTLTVTLTETATGKKAGRTEAVYIYQGMTTTVGGADWDFTGPGAFTTNLGAGGVTISAWVDAVSNTLVTSANNPDITDNAVSIVRPATVTIVAATGADYTNWQWSVRGKDVPGDLTDLDTDPPQYTFESAGRSDDTYAIGLRVEKNGVPYSTIIYITVGPPTGQVATPTVSPSPDDPYMMPRNVTLSGPVNTSGVRIFYTTDGTTPGYGSPSVGLDATTGQGSIALPGACTLRAIAVKTDMLPSEELTAHYADAKVASWATLTSALINITGSGTIYIGDDFDIIPGSSGISIPSGKNITLLADTGTRTITRGTDGASHNFTDAFFTVESGGKLTLGDAGASANTENILVLDGNYNEGAGITGDTLVDVDERGAFTMHYGATLRNNKSGSHDSGGGVRVFKGTFTMYGGEIHDNYAENNGGYGGGVALSGGGTFFTMYGGTIRDNHISNYGGGVLVYGGTSFTMNGGTISGNTAGDGGGVFVADAYGSPSGTFTMNGGTISGNTAGSGGGVYNAGDFTMSGGTIYGSGATGGLANTAATSGASLYNAGTARWGNHSTIMASDTDDTITGGSPGSISSSSLRPLIDGLDAGTRNNPTVLTLNNGTYTITNTTGITLTNKHIHLKVPAGERVTIQVTEALTSLYQTAFNLTDATLILGEAGGGTLNIDGGNRFDITNSGPLINVGADSYLEINFGVALQNNATLPTTSSGGAVLVRGAADKISTLKINGGIIRWNSIDTSNAGGGAIGLEYYSRFEMTNGSIEENYSSNNGGGIYSWNGDDRDITETWPVITISGGEICNNQATTDGGGIYSQAITTISGTATIHDNIAGGNGGGIFRNNDDARSTLTFDGGDSTIYVNYNYATGSDDDVANP